MLNALTNVYFWGQSGHRAKATSINKKQSLIDCVDEPRRRTMDTHQTTKLKTDDTEKRKRKLLTFKEFLAIYYPKSDRKPGVKSAAKCKV
jgi:hypothetical protein